MVISLFASVAVARHYPWYRPAAPRSFTLGSWGMAGHDREEFSRIRSPFEGELIRLRATEEEDLPRLNELIWDPDVTQHLSIGWPQSVEGTREWWERNRQRGDHVFVIETRAGELIGGCGLEGFDERARAVALGIWIAKPFWNKGYGTDAVRTLCGFGFREMNAARIHLDVYETNPRAVRAYEKVGFTQEGRLRSDHFVGGRPVDVIVMGLLANEFGAT